MLLPCVIMSLANVRPMICGRCYATRAGVIAHFWFYLFYGWCYCHLLWQMLLPTVLNILNMADVIAIYMWQILCHQG